MPDAGVRSINELVSQVSAGKLLENNIPVFIITFATQEVLLFRNAKTREVVVGAEDKVEQCMYVAAITRVEEELDNELTGGWKIVEVRTLSCYTQHIMLSHRLDGKTIGARISLSSCHRCLPKSDHLVHYLPDMLHLRLHHHPTTHEY